MTLPIPHLVLVNRLEKTWTIYPDAYHRQKEDINRRSGAVNIDAYPKVIPSKDRTNSHWHDNFHKIFRCYHVNFPHTSPLIDRSQHTWQDYHRNRPSVIWDTKDSYSSLILNHAGDQNPLGDTPDLPLWIEIETGSLVTATRLFDITMSTLLLVPCRPHASTPALEPQLHLDSASPLPSLTFYFPSVSFHC